MTEPEEESEFVFDAAARGVDEAGSGGDVDGSGDDGNDGIGDDAVGEGAGAASGVGPSPELDPAAAVRAQLAAIERTAVDARTAREDEAVPASVRTLFDFAAPSFRQAHGSLDGFAATMLGPMYDRLVGAETVERGAGERDGDRFTQAVLARHPDGDRTYEFVLARQPAGKYAGCWLTTSVDLVYDGESPSFRRTPTVTFGEQSVTCEVGDQLRAVLLAAEGHSPHNDVTQVANCGGNGLCGTCAVSCDGDVDEMGDRERRRLSLPPHDEESGLRLACQTHVQGDVTVDKHDGYWGQHVSEVADGADDGRTGAGAARGDGRSDPLADPPEAVVVTAAEYAGEYEYAADGPGGTGAAGGDER